MTTYLIDIEQTSKESIVFFPKVFHLSAPSVSVSFGRYNLFLEVVSAWLGVHSGLGKGYLPFHAFVVLVMHQARTVSRFDISSDHLHLFGSALEGAGERLEWLRHDRVHQRMIHCGRCSWGSCLSV